MKPKDFFIAALPLVSATLLWGGTVRAETLPSVTTLYSFPLSSTVGRNPTTALVQASDGNFYGTTEDGGTAGVGTIFRITPAGALTTIYSFTGGADGGIPRSPLLQASDGNLYGMTYSYGGPTGSGAVFKSTLSGTLTTLRTFSGMDGHRPRGPLIQAPDGNIYGTTQAGGSTYVNPSNVGDGNVIKITLGGVVSSLASFNHNTNYGASPQGGVLAANDGNFYGSTAGGLHDNGNGTFSPAGNIFQVTPGGVITNSISDVMAFNNLVPGSPRIPNRIIQGRDGNFYGTTSGGGTAGTGTVFKMSFDGTTVTKLHDFAGFNESGDNGASPLAGLLQATDGNFYGTTRYGGTTRAGTVFRITPDGVYTTLYSFTGNGGTTSNDGAEPVSALIQGSDGNLYGTTSGGGTSRAGTIFRVNAGLPPPLVASFAVNESDAPTAAAPDSVLRFKAIENHEAAGLLVHVQSSTAPAPAPESSWTDLPDGLGGRMVYAPQVTGYVLNSTNYPAANGISFRAVTRAPGYPTSISNVVGPFNLASTTPHLGPTKLFVTTNGEINAIRFGVNEETIPAGIRVRVQTTQTPAAEGSWSDAATGNGGVMTQDASDPKQFYLGTDDYPPSEGVYFRAMASAPGNVDSLSIPYGPFKFVNDPASIVTISVNGVAVAPNDIDGGYFLPSGSFNMAATASSGRLLKRVTLLYDGNTVAHFDNGATTGAIDYTSNIPGDHLIEAYATDDLGVTGAAAPIHVRILPAAPGRIFLMTNSGDWNNAANWIDSQGNPGVPGPQDFAVVRTFSPTITGSVTVNAMSLNGGTLNGTGTLTVTAFATIADGTIKANLTIPSGSTLECLNDANITLTGRLTYAGTLRLHGKGGIDGMRPTASRPTLGGPQPDGFFDFVGGIINGVGRFIADLAGGGRRGSKATPAPRPAIAPEKRIIAAATINIAAGTVTAIPAPSRLISQDGGGLIGQDGGGLISQDGGGLVASGGGNLVASGGGNLVASGGGNLITQDGGGLVASGGGNLVATGGGNLVASGGGNLVASGGGNAPTPTGGKSLAEAASTAGISLAGGELNLSGFTIYGDTAMDGGVLSGTGILLGNLTNNSGFISPGHSAGILAVTGAFAQGANGTLIVEDGGATPKLFDQLLVTGAANLGGNLIIRTINGYVPNAAATFNPLGYGSATGSFASISSNATLTAGPNGLLAQTNPAVANPASAKLANISTRMRVGTGENVMIGGFIVVGSAPKKVIIRALGPSLPVGGKLADTVLELNKADGSVITNDDWRSTQEQEIIATTVPPTNDLESAIVATLAPGNYTAVVRGKNSGTGVGLVEVYDLDAAAPSILANISTRGEVQRDDNVMIGGFIILGAEPAKVLVRAIGPSLPVAGALADTVLELHDRNGNTVIGNDNWRETQEAEIIATTVPPTNDLESALIATLVPDNYTAVVRGSNNTTGVALVEVYRLP